MLSGLAGVPGQVWSSRAGAETGVRGPCAGAESRVTAGPGGEPRASSTTAGSCRFEAVLASMGIGPVDVIENGERPHPLRGRLWARDRGHNEGDSRLGRGRFRVLYGHDRAMKVKSVPQLEKQEVGSCVVSRRADGNSRARRDLARIPPPD